jgi:thiol-disulfide isomerase/thioredoxin
MRAYSFACLIALLALHHTALNAQSSAPAQPAATQDQPSPDKLHQTPIDPKAKSSFQSANVLMHNHRYSFALDEFRKANKLDGGRCMQCLTGAWSVALQDGNFKAAREAGSTLLDLVPNDANRATAHYMIGRAWLLDGIKNHHGKGSDIDNANAELEKATQLRPEDTNSLYDLAVCQAYLERYDDARATFKNYLTHATPSDIKYDRAKRFAEHPEQARILLAPNFRVKTLDGKELSLEDLTGKVVLIDFWATWCGPCRAALPHVKDLSKKFADQPFVILSISLDKDESKWKTFVAQNGMTWLQYCDGSFNGPVATLFNVRAIPATFTIDADGALQDQHFGDADIDAKIKKLIARANELNSKRSQN